MTPLEIQTVEQAEAYVKSFSKPYRLSDRELEILQFVVIRGCSDKQIAEAFKIKLKTVQNHMFNLMRKIGCGSSREVLSRFSRFILSEQIKKASTSILSPHPSKSGAEQ